MILIAGPYRSGTDDDPDRLAANLRALEEAAWPVFRAGHVPMIGEWVALPVMRGAGSTGVGDPVSEQVLYPTAERLLQHCDIAGPPPTPAPRGPRATADLAAGRRRPTDVVRRAPRVAAGLGHAGRARSGRGRGRRRHGLRLRPRRLPPQPRRCCAATGWKGHGPVPVGARAQPRLPARCLAAAGRRRRPGRSARTPSGSAARSSSATPAPTAYEALR